MRRFLGLKVPHYGLAFLGVVFHLFLLVATFSDLLVDHVFIEDSLINESTKQDETCKDNSSHGNQEYID